MTRRGGRVVVIYANPASLPGRLVALKGRTPIVWRLKRKEPPGKPQVRERPPLYFFASPLGWWQRFGDTCAVELIPWDVTGKREERAILVNDTIARPAYRLCTWMEAKHPETALRWWSYSVIVLTKKAG